MSHWFWTQFSQQREREREIFERRAKQVDAAPVAVLKVDVDSVISGQPSKPVNLKCITGTIIITCANITTLLRKSEKAVPNNSPRFFIVTLRTINFAS